MKNYRISQIGEFDLKERQKSTEKLHFMLFIFQTENMHNLDMSSLYLKNKMSQARKEIKR